ncbi:hypothetical protein [Bradyrhizobium iriomotense]|uniref:Uncharacterized protein n=1 Tax=Bradyrhizobium iriomotense TaxID=441950 RepID=A0ABQ6B5B9_9BRAD|nr:hypothetical protein [Bradyrhizobium iriomotense]GLR88875.1 hypothetical protein GCM10007857_55880 [Bradyrhizobium iriomotense]
MPARKLVLDFQNQSFFECGATLLAVLAFPSATDVVLAEIVASICSEYLRTRFEQSDNLDELVKARYAFRDKRRIKRDLRTLDRAIRDRMAAAHVAVALLQNAIGHRPNLPGSVKRLSLNQLSEFAMGDANQSSPENFETRIWRPSLPVIHVAAAFAVAISDRERAGEKRTAYGNLIADAELVGNVVNYIEKFKNIIDNNNLKIDRRKLISIRITPPQ